MKRILTILFAAMTLVACNDDKNNDDYFKLLPLEELLSTGAGVDYLVRISGEIDKDAIVEALKDKVLVTNKTTDIFWYDHGWYNDFLIGAVPVYYVIWDEFTIYSCATSNSTGTPKKIKHKYEHDGNHYRELMRCICNGSDSNAEVVAFVENVLVIQYYDAYGRLTRQLAYIKDYRDKIVEQYLQDVE